MTEIFNLMFFILFKYLFILINDFFFFYYDLIQNMYKVKMLSRA